LFGSATAVRFKGKVGDLTTAKGTYCANYGKAVSADFTSNPDFNTYQLGVITRWAPVKNLTFSAEVMWFRLDQETTGASTLTPAAPEADCDLRVQGPGSCFVACPRSAKLLT
jgi:Porin subfamily